MLELNFLEQFDTVLAAAWRSEARFDLGQAGLRFRLVRRAALTSADQAAWQRLTDAAQAVSPFADHWFMKAALQHCDNAAEASLAIVADDAGEWLGVLPVARKPWRGKAPLPNWVAWQHPNQFVGTPLLRTGQAEIFWRALLAGLEAEPGSELAFCVPRMPDDDQITHALLEACIADGREFEIEAFHSRPGLRSGGAIASPPQQQRRIAGLERKLNRELGQPRFAASRDPERIADMIDELLKLEASGWKGRRGSALASSAGTASLFREVALAGAAAGKFEVATLHVGERLLAFSTILIGSARWYGFKSAYDENAARYGPGVLLLDWITRRFSELSPALSFDSCSASGQQPVSRLWSGELGLADYRISLGGPIRHRALQAIRVGEAAYSWLKRSV
ncbi:MAG: GNAT family N-acetyltransferase [Sphingomonadales bacterium]|nr:GNAT family N-acetyltransferase [Sphingomonadales bacterium]